MGALKEAQVPIAVPEHVRGGRQALEIVAAEFVLGVSAGEHVVGIGPGPLGIALPPTPKLFVGGPHGSIIAARPAVSKRSPLSR